MTTMYGYLHIMLSKFVSKLMIPLEGVLKVWFISLMSCCHLVMQQQLITTGMCM